MKIIPRTEVKPRSVPVAAYPISVCKFTQFELMELDQVIKRGLGKNNMVGWQATNEGLYMKRKDGAKGLKVTLGCFMSVSDKKLEKKKR